MEDNELDSELFENVLRREEPKKVSYSDEELNEMIADADDGELIDGYSKTELEEFDTRAKVGESDWKETRDIKMKIRLMRNLAQYKNLTDDEIKEKITTKLLIGKSERDFEKRIAAKIKKLGEDYDLTDLKANDFMTLRAYCQATISLEDLEQLSFKIRKRMTDSVEINPEDIMNLDKLARAMSDLRMSISKMSDDLKITRKMRKGDKEVSVISYIEDLKAKARQFYEQKSIKIFCPECKTMIGQVWVLYPERTRTHIVIACDKEVNGKRCEGIADIRPRQLYANDQATNLDDIPEGIK